MTDSNFQNVWSLIDQVHLKHLTRMPQPLLGIDPYLSHFGIHSMRTLSPEIDIICDVPVTEPSFDKLTDSVILSLRCHIYAQTELDMVAKWTEKLMRFCEIRYTKLRSRSIEKCISKAAAKLHISHIAVLFLDQAIYTRDLRYLNIALKIADLESIFTIDLRSKLAGSRDDITLALCYFRIALVTEYAIVKMCKESI